MSSEKTGGLVAIASGNMPSPAQHDEIITRYKRLRATMTQLSERASKSMDESTLDTGGKRLGLRYGKALLVKSEHDVAVLMDYCLFDVRKNGRNVVDVFRRKSPSLTGTDESLCLQAMEQAIYSVFIVERVERGVGLLIRDVLSEELYFLVDIGLSQSADERTAFASRLLPFDEFVMTSGAALPVGYVDENMYAKIKYAVAHDMPADNEGRRDPASLIRSLLQSNRGANVRTEDVSPSSSPRLKFESLPSARDVPTRVGRNDPCTCGSGRKFKQCCMRKH
jgi:hypothetical protein